MSAPFAHRLAAMHPTPNAPPCDPSRIGFTTPPPEYRQDLPIRIGERPEKFDYNAAQRIRLAASRATKIYPGPVGEYLSEELQAAAEFGYRHLNTTSPLMRIVDHLLAH